jgi:hypothetical protein
VSQPVDSSILHEIVRIIEARRKVPDKVIVTSKEYLLTYLRIHRNGSKRRSCASIATA